MGGGLGSFSWLAETYAGHLAMGYVQRVTIRNAMKSVRKSRKERFEELRQAVVIIEAGLADASRTRDIAYMSPVVVQLRALLLSNGQTPLLVSLAEELEFPLEFYSTPLDFLDNEEVAEILGPSRIQWVGDSISVDPQRPLINQKVTVSEWLASTVAVVGEQKITGEKLLKWVANKMGGAHYDVALPQELAAMSTFHSNGRPTHYLTLVRLGEIVANLGRRILNETGQ
ncbi:MAG: hypothetical protein IIC91_01065 [Chloroflexi bacterium]|nr:hypothetical protein [Chloroflexota bacterium]